METLVVLIILGAVAAWIHQAGKRTGSRKAYGVGRSHGRRRR